MRQESGYALLLVLAVIVVIGLLVPPLMSNVLTSAEQNENLAEERQLERASEAGVVYVRHFGANLQAELEAERDERLDQGGDSEEIFADLLAEIDGVFLDDETFRGETFVAGQAFNEAQQLENQIEVTDISANAEETAVTVSYVSRGEKEGTDAVHEREDEYPFYLFSEGDDDEGNGENGSDLNECDGAEENGNLNTLDCELEGDYSFTGEYEFRGNTLLIINGDVSFEELIIGGSAEITIKGSLTVQDVSVSGDGRLYLNGDEDAFELENVEGNQRIFINGEEYTP